MIHLLNPLWDAAGGSEWRTLKLFDLLRRRGEVRLWSEQDADPRLAAAYPIERIDVSAGRFPVGGTLVVVGVYFPVGSWIRESRPGRIVLHYNTPWRPGLESRLALLRDLAPLEIVFASDTLRARTGMEGVVQLSPIDISAFSPGPPRPAGAPFTVGRLSRDVPEKHHPEDPALYRRLVDPGARVRLLGGTCLPEIPGVERLPAKAEPAVDFLRSLDVFVYRTSPRWHEVFGRVVYEAMACGLPVVVHRQGGYLEHLDPGRNGLVFDTEAEAVEHLLSLKGDPGRRASLGAAARASIERLYSPAWAEELGAWYLRPRT